MKRKINKTAVMWTIHNLIAHPVSEACWWVAFGLEAIRLPKLADTVEGWGNSLHDFTVPDHDADEGRG